MQAAEGAAQPRHSGGCAGHGRSNLGVSRLSSSLSAMPLASIAMPPPLPAASALLGHSSRTALRAAGADTAELVRLADGCRAAASEATTRAVLAAGMSGLLPKEAGVSAAIARLERMAAEEEAQRGIRVSGGETTTTSSSSWSSDGDEGGDDGGDGGGDGGGSGGGFPTRVSVIGGSGSIEGGDHHVRDLLGRPVPAATGAFAGSESNLAPEEGAAGALRGGREGRQQGGADVTDGSKRRPPLPVAVEAGSSAAGSWRREQQGHDDNDDDDQEPQPLDVASGLL